MGRRPLFEKAMSDAERQRRCRRKRWGPDPWWLSLDLVPIEAVMASLKPVRRRSKAAVRAKIS